MLKNLMLSLSLYVMTVDLCYDWICLYLCYFSIDLTVFKFPLSVYDTCVCVCDYV